MAVMAGLQIPSVSRLKQTWDLLPSESWDAWELLTAQVESLDSWANLRAVMKKASPPMLPHLGVYLHDLVLLSDLNPDFITTPDGDRLINLWKHRLLYRSIANLMDVKNDPFNFQRLPPLYDFLRNISGCPSHLLYEISHVIEPIDPTLSPRPVHSSLMNSTDSSSSFIFDTPPVPDSPLTLNDFEPASSIQFLPLPDIPDFVSPF